MLTMTTYPPIPTCPGQTAGETIPEYATRVLRFVLDHGTATLTDEQLERADQAAQRYATTARNAEGKAQDLEPHQYALLKQFSDARHQLAQARTLRAEWARQDAQAAQDAHGFPTGGRQPGRPAPLLPPPPSGPGRGDTVALENYPGGDADLIRRGKRAQRQYDRIRDAADRPSRQTPADGIRF